MRYLMVLALLGACDDAVVDTDLDTEAEVDTDADSDSADPDTEADTDCPGDVEIPYNGLDDDCDPLTPDDDLDGDQYASDVDCDDRDPTINPGAIERCDAIDSDCDFDLVDAEGAFARSAVSLRILAESLLAGTASAPASVALNGEDLVFCGGSFHVRISSTGSSSIRALADTSLLGDHGPLITVQSGDLDVADVELVDGGLRCAGSLTSRNGLTLDGISQSGGQGMQGPGLWAQHCDVSGERVYLHDNVAFEDGGAIWLSDATLSLSDSTVSGNLADGAGGALAARDSTVELLAVNGAMQLSANSATEGGHLDLVRSPLTLDGVDLGQAGTADDGQPDDIATDGAPGSYQASEDTTATCSNLGVCGASETWSTDDGLWRSVVPGQAYSFPADAATGTLQSATWRVRGTGTADCSATVRVFLGSFALASQTETFVDGQLQLALDDVDLVVGPGRLAASWTLSTTCSGAALELMAAPEGAPWRGDEPYPSEVVWTPEL